jgi:YHS domain-containing protein
MNAKILDPICDMVVEVDATRDQGLTIERPEREYGFCSHGCLVKFAKSPQTYIPKVEAWLAAGRHEDQHRTGGLEMLRMMEEMPAARQRAHSH